MAFGVKVWYSNNVMQGKKEPVKALTEVKNIPKHKTIEFIKEVAEMIPKDNTPIVVSTENENFLRFYIHGQDTRNNITLSVAMAKNVDLETLSRVNDMEEVTVNGKIVKREKLNTSEYDRKCQVFAVTGHRWLRSPRGNARRMQLTSELLKDHIVDNEMAKVIIQDKDLTAKNTAMREYNKLKQRIVDRKDIRTQSVGVVRHLYGEADAFDYDDEE